MWHRKPAFAGSFYPSEKERLKELIEYYLNHVELPEVKGEVLAVISPHAGYQYSGPVAAFSYKLLQKAKPEVVVVLAPSHRSTFLGASVIDSGIYETPLGEVTIDEAMCGALLSKPNFFFIKEAHELEHSLEVQIPFLQTVLDNFTLVPLVLATSDQRITKKLVETLTNVIKNEKRRVAIVISTDLSHYHHYEQAQFIDRCFIDGLLTLDPEKMKQVLDNEAEACGEGPVLIGMEVSRNLGANAVEVLAYANSGDTAGDRERVVGYLSAAFLKQ